LIICEGNFGISTSFTISNILTEFPGAFATGGCISPGVFVRTLCSESLSTIPVTLIQSFYCMFQDWSLAPSRFISKDILQISVGLYCQDL
jgi:hypothetical protein